MVDVELVIKISEEDHERLKEYEKAPFNSLTSRVYEAIANGTPLPKGHGRLIILSEDAVRREQRNVSFSCQKWISEVGLSHATVAIIEADKETADEIDN